jgi:hypothetical protein
LIPISIHPLNLLNTCIPLPLRSPSKDLTHNRLINNHDKRDVDQW